MSNDWPRNKIEKAPMATLTSRNREVLIHRGVWKEGTRRLDVASRDGRVRLGTRYRADLLPWTGTRS